MEHLFGKLYEYAEGSIYPYHMPGHKRQICGSLPEELYKIDITEIEGFDNLHQPKGILLELQKEAAGIYGAEESYYLVNGSTCGILSAVSCALPFGGRILMARNCHKSAYHAAYLRQLQICFLYPKELKEYDIAEAVTPRQVREALEREQDIGAVFIVSPTYEGRIADISAIAGIAHERGIPLIVDEAHGAHLGLAEGFPKNSCQAGADLVIHSVHKTLPALTQTALLHVNGDLVNRGRLRRFLHIYQTSSPSYLLMASIDNALQHIQIYGREVFSRFQSFYGEMLEALSRCRHLRILNGDRNRQDMGKLLISVKGTGMTGRELYDILLEEYELQTEMASKTFVLAMFTINDGAEAYERMTKALLEIDGKLGQMKVTPENGVKPEPAEGIPESKLKPVQTPDASRNNEKPVQTEYMLEAGEIKKYLSVQEKRLEDPEVGRRQQTAGIPLAEAWDLPAEEILLTESTGRLAAEFVNLYPPGVPLLIPGERMTQEICHSIRQAFTEGLNVQGVQWRKEEAGEGLWVKVLL